MSSHSLSVRWLDLYCSQDLCAANPSPKIINHLDRQCFNFHSVDGFVRK